MLYYIAGDANDPEIISKLEYAVQMIQLADKDAIIKSNTLDQTKPSVFSANARADDQGPMLRMDISNIKMIQPLDFAEFCAFASMQETGFKIPHKYMLKYASPKNWFHRSSLFDLYGNAEQPHICIDWIPMGWTLQRADDFEYKFQSEYHLTRFAFRNTIANVLRLIVLFMVTGAVLNGIELFFIVAKTAADLRFLTAIGSFELVKRLFKFATLVGAIALVDWKKIVHTYQLSRGNAWMSRWVPSRIVRSAFNYLIYMTPTTLQNLTSQHYMINILYSMGAVLVGFYVPKTRWNLLDEVMVDTMMVARVLGIAQIIFEKRRFKWVTLVTLFYAFCLLRTKGKYYFVNIIIWIYIMVF